jgi:hypothetical protein
MATTPTLRDLARNLASLNEIVAELVEKASPDPEFIAVTRGILRDHSHSLGYAFQGEPPTRTPL